MNFGHLENGKLIKTKFPIIIDGKHIFATESSTLLKAGEKEIVYTQKPNKTGCRYSPKWEETATQIIRVWNEEVVSEAELRKRYENLVNIYVRKKYSISKESSILRKYLAYGDVAKSEFDIYNAYVETCKEEAYKIIYGEPSEDFISSND